MNSLSVKMWRFLPGMSKISASKQQSVNLAMLMFVRVGGARLGGGGEGVLMFSVFVWS